MPGSNWPSQATYQVDLPAGSASCNHGPPPLRKAYRSVSILFHVLYDALADARERARSAFPGREAKQNERNHRDRGVHHDEPDRKWQRLQVIAEVEGDAPERSHAEQQQR